MIKRTVPGREDMPAVEPPPYYVPEGVRRREENIDDEQGFKKHVEKINQYVGLLFETREKASMSVHEKLVN